ncbi:hypothetical protein MG293_013857 [Ovis ammon polii]|uniref:Ig-like domain-containing protein n=1 Tax=Ovis ammon polii TaxID=230172 RepID=A0AAD4U3F4_OVIAM|nr:hypothetical protein MG293_013857 [Ovis ammon polii]
MAMMTRDSRQSPAFVTDDRVLASVLPTTLHPVTSSSMIKFTLSKVVDMFSDLPERDTHFLVLPLNPSNVSLLQKPQQSDSQVTGCGDRGRALGRLKGLVPRYQVWTPESPSLSLPPPGSWAQAVLTQPSSVSRSLGQSVSITCSGSSSNVGYGEITSVTAAPTPEHLSRFSGSKDASTNAGLLLISGLQPEDEADYHCAVWHGDTNAHTVLQSSEEARQKTPPLTPARGSDEVELRGSWAQALLTQPPSVSRTLGQRVTLSRTGSSSNTGVIM